MSNSDFLTVAGRPETAAAGGQGGLFGLAERRLSWIDSRQRQLAENIANADTPGYKPRDLLPFDTLVNRYSVAAARTSPLHLAPAGGAEPGARPVQGETAPDGNAVSLETEMTKIADDDTQQRLVGNIWKSYMGLFMTALGKS